MIVKFRIIFLVFLLLIFPCSGCQANTLKASITILVMDANGVLLKDAEVSVGYQESTMSGTKDHVQNGMTDSSGEYVSSGRTNGHITYVVKKSGFYPSRGTYGFGKRSGLSWAPDKPVVKVVMREVKKPIPMYARDTSRTMLEIPKLGVDVGFDLIEFDWVTPYGKGKNPDFIFNLKREYKDRNNYEGELTLTFANKHDGIAKYYNSKDISSVFKHPYTATADKYINKIIVNKNKNNGISSVNPLDEENYMFRVRTEEINNNYYRSMYGKIHGPIKFYLVSTDTGHLSFRYYLNPDYTKNLEFDMNHNLFENLERREKMKIY